MSMAGDVEPSQFFAQSAVFSVPAKESEGLGGGEQERLGRMEAWSRTLHGEREIARQLC